MTNTTPLESLLRSWTPRSPSAAFERRLFPASRAVPRPAMAWLWLSPVAACLVLCGLLPVLRGTAPALADPRHAPLVAMILSNQSYAAYLPGRFQPAQNRWDTFEWTNVTRFPSSERPFPRLNRMIARPHGQN